MLAMSGILKRWLFFCPLSATLYCVFTMPDIVWKNTTVANPVDVAVLNASQSLLPPSSQVLSMLGGLLIIANFLLE